MCADGDVCTGPEEDDARCRLKGQIPDNGPCERDRDCASYICNSQLCLGRCEVNSDCPLGPVCSRVGGVRALACVNPVNSDCGMACGMNEVCIEGECSVPNPCRSGADCVGDCLVYEVDDLIRFECSQEAMQVCGPNEIQVMDYRGGNLDFEFCALPIFLRIPTGMPYGLHLSTGSSNSGNHQ